MNVYEEWKLWKAQQDVFKEIDRTCFPANDLKSTEILTSVSLSILDGPTKERLEPMVKKKWTVEETRRLQLYLAVQRQVKRARIPGSNLR